MRQLVARDACVTRNPVRHVTSTSVFGQMSVECMHNIDGKRLLLEQAQSILTVAEDHVVTRSG